MRVGLQELGIPLPSSNTLVFTFQLWSFGAFLYCFFRASGTFDKDISLKVFSTLITKPIYFWEYQLSQFLGLFFVYIFISLGSILLILIKALIYKIDFPNLFLLRIICEWIDSGSMILIIFSLALVMRKSSAIAVFLGVYILNAILSQTASSTNIIVQILKEFLYMITPAHQNLDFDTVSDSSFADMLQMLLEYISLILYAGTMMILSNLYYYKKDYPLRDHS